MKKVWWVITLLLIVSSAYAQEYQSFSATITPQQKNTKTNETATYELSIFNNGRNGQIFEVFSPDIVWDVRTDKSLFVPPKKTLAAQLLIRPLNVNSGLYGIPLTIRKVGAQDSIKQTVFLELRSTTPPTSTYLPAFRGNASMPRRVEPGKELVISLNIENLNRRNLSEVIIKLRSNVINKDYVTSLEPREKKLLTFSTLVEKSVLPQKDLLRMHIIKSENEKSYQYEVNPLQYEVLPYDNVIIDEKEGSDFLVRMHATKISNLGNVPRDIIYTKKINFFKRLFTKVYPKAAAIKGAYEWNIRLDVGEERTVSATTNYRPAAITVFAILVVLFAYYLFRSQLSVKKTAVILSTKEGGISEMKIRINVRNRSRNTIRNISIIDLVPKIADVDKKFDSTMIAPSQIVRNDKKGTLVKWSIEHLDGGEEHILTYRMTSKFSILGGATLPVAVARFTTADKKERTTFSNRCKVNLVR